jgi:hypothetical protein
VVSSHKYLMSRTVYWCHHTNPNLPATEQEDALPHWMLTLTHTLTYYYATPCNLEWTKCLSRQQNSVNAVAWKVASCRLVNICQQEASSSPLERYGQCKDRSPFRTKVLGWFDRVVRQVFNKIIRKEGRIRKCWVRIKKVNGAWQAREAS